MQLFYDTVYEINICDYTQEQVDTWVLENMIYEIWLKKLQTKLTYIVEENGQIVGFGQLESDGHIDCFYYHNKHQRKGIGSMLLNHIEKTAKALGIKRLFTEASITAKPFFQILAFSAIREQQVEWRGVYFHNFALEKLL
jgi:N-acetylglutamate synthase-like GNAT family acetyltransferase